MRSYLHEPNNFTEVCCDRRTCARTQWIPDRLFFFFFNERPGYKASDEHTYQKKAEDQHAFEMAITANDTDCHQNLAHLISSLPF